MFEKEVDLSAEVLVARQLECWHSSSSLFFYPRIAAWTGDPWSTFSQRLKAFKLRAIFFRRGEEEKKLPIAVLFQQERAMRPDELFAARTKLDWSSGSCPVGTPLGGHLSISSRATTAKHEGEKDAYPRPPAAAAAALLLLRCCCLREPNQLAVFN